MRCGGEIYETADGRALDDGDDGRRIWPRDALVLLDLMGYTGVLGGRLRMNRSGLGKDLHWGWLAGCFDGDGGTVSCADLLSISGPVLFCSCIVLFRFRERQAWGLLHLTSLVSWP